MKSTHPMHKILEQKRLPERKQLDYLRQLNRLKARKHIPFIFEVASKLDPAIWKLKIFMLDKDTNKLKFVTKNEDDLYEIKLPNSTAVVAKTQCKRIAGIVAYLCLKYPTLIEQTSINDVFKIFISPHKKLHYKL